MAKAKNENNKKTVKTGDIIEVYKILSAAGRSKMAGEDRRALHNALWGMKKVADDFNAYRDEAVKNLKPEGYDKIAETADSLAKMKAGEREAALTDPKNAEVWKTHQAFVSDLDKCLGEMLVKETEPCFEPIGEKAFDALLDSNPDWPNGLDMQLEEFLCGRKG